MDQIEKFVKDSGLTISAYNVCFYDSNGIRSWMGATESLGAVVRMIKQFTPLIVS